MSERLAVAVSGFLGKMGREVVLAVQEAEDMVLVAGTDTSATSGLNEGFPTFSSVNEMLQAAKPRVMVDFTIPSAVYDNVNRALSAGVHCVVGTTGLTPSQRENLGQMAEENGVGLLIAPNFAVGAVLMMQFAKQAAKYFGGVEIVELHHNQKLDSPSGTALLTAQGIGDVWSRKGETADSGQPARGQECSGVQVHSVRLPGLVAHQEVLMGNPGELLTIRHDSMDRKCFMPGVLLAVREIVSRKGLVFGLENLLF